MLKIKRSTPKIGRSGVFIDNFERVKCIIQHINLLLLFITLNLFFSTVLGYKVKKKHLCFSGTAQSIIFKFKWIDFTDFWE